MKATVNTGGKDIIITLTKDQLAEINKQTSKIKDYTDIKSYEDACKLLKSAINKKASVIDKLQIIARAINKLIDNNTNFPDWENTSEYKWYPVFKNVQGHGLAFGGSFDIDVSFSGMAAFIKNEEASNYFGKQFIGLFEEMRKIKY